MFAASAVALIPAVQLGLWIMHPLPPISNGLPVTDAGAE